MQDFRARATAWSVACFILLSAAGGYVYWIKRSRAVMSARSLTAANHPVNPVDQTRTLHVEGCRDDFVVKVGELVEPRVVPGSPLDEFREIYGRETKRIKTGSAVWEPNAYALDESSTNGLIHVALNQGHVIETLDGIELGIDSFNAILHKMRDRQVEVHERIAKDDRGEWRLILSFYSTCGRKFRSEYLRTLPSDAETDRLIAPRVAQTASSPQAANQASVSGLLRSDVFLNKIATEYTMVVSDGHDDATEGSPAEHE